jgi:hypothetical protein
VVNTDTYSYAFNGPGAVAMTITSGPQGVTTSVTQPTWTGTATSPVGSPITGVTGEIDSLGATAATITTGLGTDSVTWSWTAPAVVVNGSHSVAFVATDFAGGTGTIGTTFTENGTPLLITGAVTNPTASTIVVTFNGPVTCPNDGAAWSFTNTYIGPGFGVVGTASPTSVSTGPGVDQCSLNFPAIGSNDYGPLSYTEPALVINRVVGNPGPALASNPTTGVVDATAPTLASVASAPGNTVTLTYSEPILCSTVAPTGIDYNVSLNGTPDIISAAACGGIITHGSSVTVVLTVSVATVATEAIIASNDGIGGRTVTDAYGNYETLNSVFGTVS